MLSANISETPDVVGQASAVKRYKYEVNSIVLNRIKAEKLRTGIGSRALLHGSGHLCPEGLSGDMIDRWVCGRTAKADWEHIDWVLKQYARLPTKF